jgi:Domain of unknown function (DUF4189)
MHRRFLTSLVVFLLTFALTSRAHGDREKFTSTKTHADVTFGSIAYSPSWRVFGFTRDYSSSDEAGREAMGECISAERRRASACRIVLLFKNTCGALAEGDDGWGTGASVDRPAAERDALTNCRHYSRNCKVTRWVCTTPDSGSQELVTQQKGARYPTRIDRP